MTPEIVLAGDSFLRPGGREGPLNIQAGTRGPDYHVTSQFDLAAVPGQDAVAALDALKQIRPNSSPLLFGSPHEAGILLERGRTKPTPAEWLMEARRCNIDTWLAERKSNLENDQDRDEPFPLRGPWPDIAYPMTNLAVPNEPLRRESKPVVIIGLLPTADVTEAAAYLNYGGWNDCPKPPVHVCLARRWRDQYGAVQVSNTYDRVEFRVAKPLTNRKDALDLALLQYHYCSDSIPDTLEETAAGLIGATVWHFWWD
jgi:hypothetical protein